MLSENTAFSCSNLDVMISTPVLNNKDNKGQVKPEPCLTSLRHTGKLPNKSGNFRKYISSAHHMFDDVFAYANEASPVGKDVGDKN